MYQSLDFFATLAPAHLDWVLANSTSRTFISEAFLVREGKVEDCIFFIADGLFDVCLGIDAKQRVAQLGRGAVVGEISWLENSVPTASIRAVENGEALALPRVLLEAKLAQDPAFCADFYRALAHLSAARLRESNQRARKAAAAQSTPVASTGGSATLLEETVIDFKNAVAALDRALLQKADETGSLTTALRSAWKRMYETLDDVMCATPDERTREAIGALAQREVLPLIVTSDIAERWYGKPRGYAGDYLTIEHMYEARPSGRGRVGPVIDAIMYDIPPAIAVRNRRGILREEISALLQKHPERQVRITSMACGPARELFDVFDGPLGAEARKRLIVTALDIDLEALALLDGNITKRGLKKNIQPVHGNLIYLATGRQAFDHPPQDLMYSIGLIDYFNDKFVVGLMDWVHGRLAVGGNCILGNFDPANRAKSAMDYVIEWKLIHRTPADMDRLYQASAFARACTRVVFEEQKINLFAECVKQA